MFACGSILGLTEPEPQPTPGGDSSAPDASADPDGSSATDASKDPCIRRACGGKTTIFASGFETSQPGLDGAGNPAGGGSLVAAAPPGGVLEVSRSIVP